MFLSHISHISITRWAARELSLGLGRLGRLISRLGWIQVGTNGHALCLGKPAVCRWDLEEPWSRQEQCKRLRWGGDWLSYKELSVLCDVYIVTSRR